MCLPSEQVDVGRLQVQNIAVVAGHLLEEEVRNELLAAVFM